MVDVPKIKIQEITTDPAPTLEGIAVPHTRNNRTYKVGGETLADLVHANEVNLPLADNGIKYLRGVTEAGSSVRVKPTLLSLYHFGAVGDGVADDTAAWVKWHSYHEAHGSKFRPIGPGRFKLTTGTTYAITSGCEIVGAGMGVTEIIHNDTTAQNLFSWPTPLAKVVIRDLSIRGSHDANRSFLGAYPLYVRNTKTVEITGVEVSYSRVMGIVVRGADRVTVTGCHVHHCARDGINTASCSEAIIIGNRIHDCDDDAIGVHNQVYSYQRGHVIANNKIRKSQGIRALGAQGVSITGNVLEYFFGGGITVNTVALDGTALEGINATVGVVISGNTLLDGINRAGLDNLNQTAAYIILGSASARAGSLTAIPGTNKQPGFDLPYDYFPNVKSAGENVSTTPIPLSQQILITGNILGRTMKESGGFSDYGFGKFWLRGGEYDLDLSATSNTRIYGVQISGGIPTKAIGIRGNQSFGLSSFLALSAPSANGHEVVVEGNDIRDMTRAFLCGTTTTTQKVVFRNNDIDLDPYHRSSGRQSDGSWSSSTDPTAFTLDGMKGLEAYGNRFRNVNRPMDRDLVTAMNDHSVIFDGNIFEGDAAAANSFSTSNKGCGVFPTVGNTQVIYVESNPNSADYGLLYNAMRREHSTMPTTGKYMIGWFVRNRAPTISSGKVLIGWVRLTTGSGHVAGTDWSPVYGTTT